MELLVLLVLVAWGLSLLVITLYVGACYAADMLRRKRQ